MLASRFWIRISGFWFLASDFRPLFLFIFVFCLLTPAAGFCVLVSHIFIFFGLVVPGFWFLASDLWPLVFLISAAAFWFLVFGFFVSVFFFWLVVPGFWFLACSIWILASYFWLLVCFFFGSVFLLTTCCIWFLTSAFRLLWLVASWARFWLLVSVF